MKVVRAGAGGIFIAGAGGDAREPAGLGQSRRMADSVNARRVHQPISCPRVATCCPCSACRVCLAPNREHSCPPWQPRETPMHGAGAAAAPALIMVPAKRQDLGGDGPQTSADAQICAIPRKRPGCPSPPSDQPGLLPPFLGRLPRAYSLSSSARPPRALRPGPPSTFPSGAPDTQRPPPHTFPSPASSP